MSALLKFYSETAGQSLDYVATQDELDEIAFLLDRLEEVEVYQDAPSLSNKDKKDAEAEMNSLFDRLDALIKKV